MAMAMIFAPGLPCIAGLLFQRVAKRGEDPAARGPIEIGIIKSGFLMGILAMNFMGILAINNRI
jgi:hypothetical protein